MVLSICITTIKQLNIIKQYERAFTVKFTEKKVFGGVLEDSHYASEAKQDRAKSKPYNDKNNDSKFHK